MADHLFISDNGNLYDTRRTNWYENPLREKHQYHFSHIETTGQLLATLRAGQYTFPGGYRLFFITSDGAALSFDAVRGNLYQVIYSIRHGVSDGWRVIGCDTVDHYDESPLHCEHTGEQLNDCGE